MGGGLGANNLIQNNTIRSHDRAVVIRGGASNNSVGAAGVGNAILDNNRGVVITDLSVGNRILNNTLFNPVIDIDLGGDGITANDLLDGDTGPNNLQNTPILQTAIIGSTNLNPQQNIQVTGILNSTPNGVFTIQLFANVFSVAGNPDSLNDQVFLGEIQVVTDENGNGAFSPLLPIPEGLQVSNQIIATATDGTGSTSEFSPAIDLVPQNIVLPLVSVGISPAPVTEGAAPGTLSLFLTTPAPVGGLTVSYDLTGSTALNPADFTLAAAENLTQLNGANFTIAPGATTASLQVIPVDDSLLEANEQIQFNLRSGSGYGLDGIANQASVILQDNEVARFEIVPLVGLVTSEDGDTASFTVALSAPPTATVTVSLASNDLMEGTVAVSSLSFTPENWDQPQPVAVTGVNDALVDPDTPYTVTVGGVVTSLDPNFNSIAPATVNLTNRDNDIAGVLIPNAPRITHEDGLRTDQDTFPVVLTSQPSADVVVNLISSDLSEGRVSQSALTFTSLNWNIPQLVTLAGVDDTVVDGDISYTIETTVSTTDPGYQALDPIDLAVSNIDDDRAGIQVTPTAGLTTSENGGFAQFEVVLTSQPTGNVATNLSSDNPDEGQVSRSTLTFTPETWNTAQTVLVMGVDDAVADGDQLYTIVLDSAVSSDPTYAAIDPDNVRVTNADNEAPGIIVNPISGLTTTEAGGSDTFEILLTSQPTDDVTIMVASSDTTEGVISGNSTLVFTNENWTKPQTITVAGVDDDQVDGPVSYTLVTTVETGDPIYQTLAAADVQVTNTDDDVPGILITPTTGLTTSEAGGTAQFAVVLASRPITEVVINLSSSNIQEGTLGTSALTFNPANWDTPQVVTITGVDDEIADGNIPYTIITEAALSADENYSGLELEDINVVNADNDLPGIRVSPTSGLITTESGGTAEFTIVLNTQPTANVVLNLSSSNSLEGVPSLATVNFSPVNWFQPQTITVTGVGDGVVDPDVLYSILTSATQSDDPAYDNLNPDDVSVTNRNTDLPVVNLTVSPGIGTEAEMTAIAVTATVSSPVIGNQTIDLSVTGTGITPTDYALSGLQIVIPDGQIQGMATLTIVDDFRRESDEVAILTLANPSPGIFLGPQATANLTIQDNDVAPTIAFAESNYRVNEAGDRDSPGFLDVTLNRIGDITDPSTVTVQFEAGTAIAGQDFDDTPIVITFEANESIAQVSIPILEDLTAEATEGFTLVLANPGAGTELGDPRTALVEILDNENPDIDSSVTQLAVAEGGAGSRYELVLATQPRNRVTIAFDSGDQLEPIGAIEFTPENWDIPQTVEVFAVDDDAVEGAHTGEIIQTVTSEDANYDGFSLETIQVDIADNDQADVLVTPLNLPLEEGGASASYSLVLTRPPISSVTVSFDPGDQLNPIAAIEFTPENWEIPQTVEVSAIDDTVIEGEQIASVRHQVSSEDLNYEGLLIPVVQTVITDNDFAAQVIFTPVSLTAAENGATASYTLVLDTSPTAPVTVNFTPEDLLEPIDVIVFDSSNWDTPQTVTVVAVDDNFVESEQVGLITHEVQSDDNNFAGLEITDVEIAIADNDVARVEITQTGGTTRVREDGATDTYQVVLTSQPTRSVRVTLSPDSQLDIGEGPEGAVELIFTPETWDSPQTITVAAIDDSLVEATTHTATINYGVRSDDPDYNLNSAIRIDGTQRVNLTVAITDNDEPLPPGTPGFNLIQPVRQTDVLEGFGDDLYKLVLTSEPTAAVKINLDPGSQLQADQRSLTFTPANWNIPQSITVTAIDDGSSEGQQTTTIIHTASSEDFRYDGLAVATLEVTVSDNDNRGEQLTFSEPVIQSFSDADDRGTGSDGSDVFYGNRGNDLLRGARGEDLILGQAGADGLFGGGGNDVLIGGQDNDHIQGSGGDDVIFGDRGRDRLNGGQGNDQLFGNFGNDRLLGEQGTDTLAGGRGNDAFVLGLGSGSSDVSFADRILDFTDTEDVIELQGSLTFDQLEITASPGGALIQVLATGEFLAILENVDTSNLTAQDFI
ncbi:MAG: hypothetical protein HC920_06335 [Oscillatoriales cyanobacterium SM2_3_0]|nr:hypothetical protein [Oscillatoriales cyanobacterium SM2_3_0]